MVIVGRLAAFLCPALPAAIAHHFHFKEADDFNSRLSSIRCDFDIKMSWSTRSKNFSNPCLQPIAFRYCCACCTACHALRFGLNQWTEKVRFHHGLSRCAIACWMSLPAIGTPNVLTSPFGFGISTLRMARSDCPLSVRPTPDLLQQGFKSRVLSTPATLFCSLIGQHHIGSVCHCFHRHRWFAFVRPLTAVSICTPVAYPDRFRPSSHSLASICACASLIDIE